MRWRNLWNNVQSFVGLSSWSTYRSDVQVKMRSLSNADDPVVAFHASRPEERLAGPVASWAMDDRIDYLIAVVKHLQLSVESESGLGVEMMSALSHWWLSQGGRVVALDVSFQNTRTPDDLKTHEDMERFVCRVSAGDAATMKPHPDVGVLGVGPKPPARLHPLWHDRNGVEALFRQALSHVQETTLVSPSVEENDLAAPRLAVYALALCEHLSSTNAATLVAEAAGFHNEKKSDQENHRMAQLACQINIRRDLTKLNADLAPVDEREQLSKAAQEDDKPRKLRPGWH